MIEELVHTNGLEAIGDNICGEFRAAFVPLQGGWSPTSDGTNVACHGVGLHVHCLAQDHGSH